MREYSSVISLSKNARGIYSLDTSIGCNSGMMNEVGGCYKMIYRHSVSLYGCSDLNGLLRCRFLFTKLYLKIRN